MTFVLGREAGLSAGPSAHLGHYRALDGSHGAPLHLDVDGPHVGMVVGKRGYGKSYTLGVLAEGLATTQGVAPIILDPMGVFDSMASGDTIPATVVTSPRIAPGTLDPRSWCALVGLSPESGAGGLVWAAAGATETLAAMREHVAAADAPGTDRRAARNHLDLAASWDVFEPEGLDSAALCEGECTVVDVSGLDPAPMNAVLRGIAAGLYRARVEGTVQRLPWLLVDEAHAFFGGVARPALETLCTRGRAPGVSLVAATQRPSALPDVAVSQADLLVAHRLTAGPDVEALARTQPTYLRHSIAERLPEEPGAVLVVDDATETVHTATIRERETSHGGGSPRARDVAVSTG